MADEILDIENRKKIYQCIKSNPGLSLSDVSKILGMNVPLVDYHTQYLEDRGLITIAKEEGYKRYFLKGETGAKDKKLLSALRKDIPLRIVEYLLEHPNALHKEILQNFEISKSTLSYHLDKLVKNEIIIVHRKGENKGYQIFYESEITRFLIKYKPSKVLKRFKDSWDDFNII